MLQLPVRCRDCQERFHSSIFFVLRKDSGVKRAQQPGAERQDG